MTSPSQIAIVGDRLFTDVMMANLMGAHGFWVKDGTIGPHSFVSLWLVFGDYANVEYV